MYRPLYLDLPLEKNEAGLWKKVFEKIRNYFFFGIDYRKWRREVNEISRQLRQRTTFPQEAWLESGDSIARVKKLLNLIQEYGDWPNDHFIPEDPLQHVLLPLIDACEPEELLMDLEETFGVTYREEETHRACRDWTLGQLITDVLKQRQGSENS